MTSKMVDGPKVSDLMEDMELMITLVSGDMEDIKEVTRMGGDSRLVDGTTD